MGFILSQETKTRSIVCQFFATWRDVVNNLGNCGDFRLISYHFNIFQTFISTLNWSWRCWSCVTRLFFQLFFFYFNKLAIKDTPTHRDSQPWSPLCRSFPFSDRLRFCVLPLRLEGEQVWEGELIRPSALRQALQQVGLQSHWQGTLLQHVDCCFSPKSIWRVHGFAPSMAKKPWS